MLHSFLSGAIMLASWAVAVFFFRFRKVTGDKFFVYFAIAFFLFGIERMAAEFMPSDFQKYIYLIRLAAFLLILFAIWDKNRGEKSEQ